MHRANACRRWCQVRATRLVRTKAKVIAMAGATPLELASRLGMGSERVAELTP